MWLGQVATSLTAIEDDSEQTCVGTCKDGQPDTAEMDAVRRILDSDEVLDFAAVRAVDVIGCLRYSDGCIVHV